MAEEINYDAYSGEILPNGNLRVRTFGRFAGGEIWDGNLEVTPQHPNYALWLSQIVNKAEYWAAIREDIRQARELRRNQAKALRRQNTHNE